MKFRIAAVLFLAALFARSEAMSPMDMAAALEARMAAGDGVTLPDADAELVRHAGTIDLSGGDWPGAFVARAGETVCVAVSPYTGCYEFFDESGAVFWTVVPVLPTTENWVAPFRHAEDGSHPDDALYAPWRLVDVWFLAHAEFAELESHAESAENAETLVARRSSLVTRGAADTATNLCFTSFSYTDTNICFTAAWPTNEALPQSVLDLYGSTNLSSSWTLLSSHPATTNPVSISVAHETLPWCVAPTQHVHDASCVSLTNVVISPLDGITVYTNAFWSCSTNRTPGEAGFFRLGTRHDTDGDGLCDAAEVLVHGTRPDRLDSDGDGVPDGVSAAEWFSNPLWATNGMDADFIVDIVAPSDGSAETVLTLDGWRIPLSPPAGFRAFSLPPGEIVSCSASSSGPFFVIWAGTSGGSFWGTPESFEKPFWADGIGNVSGYHAESGTCQIAVPVLTVEPDFGGGLRSGGPANGSHVGQDGSVCVHAADGIQRYTWTIAPAVVAAGRTPTATGAVRLESGNPFMDVSLASGVLSGSFGFGPGGGLWGSLTNVLSAHRCDATPTNPLCSVCGCPGLQINASISISQDYRYALFGTTNMSRFAATVQGCDTNDVVWTVSPDLPDGVWLHASDDPESVGEAEIAGVAQVWADSGFSTNQFTITASFPLVPDNSVSTTFTTVAVDAEAICTETDPSGFVVNPISVPIGETATFRVKVFPASVPDSHIEWRIVYGAGNADFVGPRYGREVHLRGDDVGDVWLEVHISGYNGPIPQFQTTVMPLYDVPVVAWIVCDDNGQNPATTESRVRTMVDQANYLLRQVCISCYVHQINYTNHTAWLDLGTWGTPNFSTNLQQMTAVSNPVFGIEAHFVDMMDKAVGVHSTNGMALSDQANFHTFAHEAGHAMGLADIYSWHPDTSLKVTGSVRRNWSPIDWCGDSDRGFYPDADCLPQSNLVERLVMCGIQGGPQRDFSWGNIHGIRRTWITTTSFEMTNAVSVGVFPGTIPPYPNHH